MYSESGIAINSASVSFSGDVFFQLFASLGSFLIEAEEAGAITGDSLKGVKLALAAVDATDWAMEGTVTCAKREEGRGLLTGAAATATTGATTLGAATTLAAALLAGLEAGAIVAAGLAAALVATAWALVGAGAGLAATLAGVLAGVLALVLATGLATAGLAAGVFLAAAALAGLALGAATLATGLADFADLDATAGLTALAGVAGFLATALVAGLATGFAAVLAATLAGAALALVLAAAGLAVFAGTAALLPAFLDTASDFVFTSCLLADGPVPLSCAAFGAAEALFLDVDRFDSAGECTGFPLGNPISCKSETIISLPFHAPQRLPYCTWPTAG